MVSMMARVVRLYILWTKAKVRSRSAKLTENAIQDAYLKPEPFTPPNLKVKVSRIDAAVWPIYRLSNPQSSTGATQAIIYLHGGAWFHEIQRQQWLFLQEIVLKTGFDVIVPIYPLLPRPSAKADLVIPEVARLIRDLSAEIPITSIMGDSAGGTIALAACLYYISEMKADKFKVPKIVLISPVLDLQLTHPDLDEVDSRDPWLAAPGLRVAAQAWAGDLPLTSPVVSPLFGDFSHLPPTLLMCGTDDILVTDARRMKAKIAGQTDSCTKPGSAKSGTFSYIEKDDMIHVYPILPCAEGHEAIQQITEFLTTSTETAP